MSFQVFSPNYGSTVSLDVTTSTARVLLSTTKGNQLSVSTSAGADDVFIKLGGDSVIATTSDYHIKSGSKEIISYNPEAHTYIAAITASGTATIKISTGYGA